MPLSFCEVLPYEASHALWYTRTGNEVCRGFRDATAYVRPSGYASAAEVYPSEEVLVMVRALCLFFATVCVVGLAGLYSASAAGPKVLGRYGEWKAHVFEEKDSKVCYMSSQPLKAEGDYTQRGDVFVLITHRASDKTTDVFSVVAGYTYEKDSSAHVKIGKKNFSLFTSGDRAWARNEKTDHKISRYVRKGSEMVIRGTSSRGTLTTDTYSLIGATQAWKAINSACGVKSKS